MVEGSIICHDESGEKLVKLCVPVNEWAKELYAHRDEIELYDGYFFVVHGFAQVGEDFMMKSARIPARDLLYQYEKSLSKKKNVLGGR